MTAVKKGDFIEIEYVGRIVGSDAIFDLTDEKLAKEHNLFNPQAQYGPLIICLGEGQILAGLEKGLEGKEPGKKIKLDLTAEEAFGKKDPKLLKIVSSKFFKRDKIQPIPGLRVSLDGQMGTIRSSTGGRVVVDFNHPLAGRDVSYEVTILRKVEKTEEQVRAFLKNTMGVEDFSFAEGNVTISFPQEVPKEISEQLTKKIKEVIPAVKDVLFKVKKEAKK